MPKLFRWGIKDVERPQDANHFAYGQDIDMSYDTGCGNFFNLAQDITPQHIRTAIYNDVDFIDKFDEVVSKYVTDMAQDATQYSSISDASVWISSQDDFIQTELDSLNNRLGIDDKSTYFVRSMIKYGDKFCRAIIDPRPNKGIVSLKDTYHPKAVVRLENAGKLVGFHIGEDKIPVQRYEMIHWMTPFEPVFDDILAKRRWLFQKHSIDKDPTYGFSDLFKVIATSKRLKYIEDALILARLTKSKLYRIHNIEVGASTTSEQIAIAKRYAKNWNRSKGQNYTDDDAFSQENQFSHIEDRFNPVRESKGRATIEELGGDMNVTGIADLEHLVKKRNFILGFPADSDSMTNRLQEDSKYARRVATHQRSFIKGLYQLYDVHLDLIGRYSSERKYTVHMIDVDSFVQSERNDMMLAAVEFIERVVGLADAAGEKDLINREYLLRYLIEHYLKFPGIEYDELFAKVSDSDIEENTYVTKESTLSTVMKYVNSDSYSKGQLNKLRSILTEKSKRFDDENIETYVKSNSGDVLKPIEENNKGKK